MHLLSLSNHFIFGFLIFCLILIASSVVYADNDSTPNVNQTTQINLARSSMKIKGFSDPEMDFQLMRSIGTDWYGGGILGEILLAASEITDGDPSNWPKSFAQLGM
ncbi:MAG TPA: hypothetical protein GX009_10010, partial [Candidatus Atribacteria bacterium]|nr:hypothetical protein [Candidatus Atribacteria bacterium]